MMRVAGGVEKKVFKKKPGDGQHLTFLACVSRAQP